MNDDCPGRQYAVLLGVGFEGAIGVVALVVGWLMGYPPLAGFSFSTRALAIGLAAAAPLLGLFAMFFYWSLPPFVRLRRMMQETLLPLFRACTLFDLAIVSLAAGVGEEMLFRGVLQAAFTDWWGVPAGVVLASCLFGVAHCLTLTYALIAGAIGVYLGLLWLMTDNLLAPIAAHAGYDFLALAYWLRVAAPAAKTTEPTA